MNLTLLLGLKRVADYKSESRMLSKQIARMVVPLVCSSLILTAIFVGTLQVASMPQATGSSPSAPRNAAIVATTVAILKETSEIRKLAILRPVKSGAQSRTEIERTIVRNLDEQTSSAEMHATELALQKLFLLVSCVICGLLRHCCPQNAQLGHEPHNGSLDVSDRACR